MARREIVAEGEVGLYHCMCRCVRRAFLCGEDDLSGQSFEHRKEWVQDRLCELAGAFAIDVAGFAVMSNHLHVVVRQRPDIAEQWSPQEVATRWRRIYTRRRDKHGTPLPLTDAEIAAAIADAETIDEWRTRLGNLSWFMRSLAEWIARRANKEDECTGRFWEGRFKSQALLDESAVLACMAYVDLNPVRAGVAETPEESSFTSIKERIEAQKARRRAANQRRRARRRNRKRADRAGSSSRLPNEQRDQWLSPLAGDPTPTSGEKLRASDKPFLSIGLDDYLKLVDWTGRQLRSDKRGAIPGDVAPILDRLQVRGDGWLGVVEHFGRWFRHAAGRAESVAQRAVELGRSHLHGIGPARLAFK
jgi:REP element-mobilizing transposase RayT